MYTTVLNWLLGINFFTYLFRNELPINIPISAFLIPTFLLLTLELVHFGLNLIQDKPRHDTFYRNLDSGDVWRMFSALAIATWFSADSTPIVSILVFGIVAVVAAIAAYITCISWLRKKQVTAGTIAGLACLYVLCGWLLTLYISQYGTREFGHWLERPKYTVTVPVTVAICSQKYTCSGDGEPAQAYIGVINESYLEDSGYDDDRSVSVDYREIWVLNFTTTASGEVHKITSGYLDDESSGWVEDDLGRRWLLSIKNYK